MTDNTPQEAWTIDGLVRCENGEVGVRLGLRDDSGNEAWVTLDPEAAERMGRELVRRAQWARGQSPARNRD